MKMNIDIERLIDLVEEQNTCYNDYCYSGKTLYNGNFDGLKKRKDHLSYANQSHDRAQSAVQAIIEVLQLDSEQQKRLYIATRAVCSWRVRTGYAFLMPATMKNQIHNFIFA